VCEQAMRDDTYLNEGPFNLEKIYRILNEIKFVAFCLRCAAALGMNSRSNKSWKWMSEVNK